MSIKLFLLALFITLVPTTAFSQGVEIRNLSDGDFVDLESLQFNVKIDGIPNESVQSRIEIEIWRNNQYFAKTLNNCQVGDGTYHYNAFRIEMLNFNKLGEFWCLEKDKVMVVAKMIDVVNSSPSGTQFQVIASLEWYDNGWQEVTDVIFVYAK